MNKQPEALRLADALTVEFRAIMCLVAAGRCSRLELF
jgi:hypothetical protein